MISDSWRSQMHPSHLRRNQIHMQDFSLLVPIRRYPKIFNVQSVQYVGMQKIQKVVTSTLSAETNALTSAVDQASWLRLFWSWLHDPTTRWRKPEEALKKVAPAITVPTMREASDLATTDCKSLFGLTTRTAPPSCSEFRVQLVARATQEALNELIQLRWVHSGAQLADCLTKAMESHFMRETLKLGSYRLCDEDATLKERAKTKDRLRWLKDHQTGNDGYNMNLGDHKFHECNFCSDEYPSFAHRFQFTLCLQTLTRLRRAQVLGREGTSVRKP